MVDNKQSYTLEDLELRINGNIIGGAQSATINVVFTNIVLGEGGTKKTREIVTSQMRVDGSVERLHIDNDLLKDTIDFEEGNNPSINIIGTTKNKTPERKITVIGAVFRGGNLTFGLSDASTVTHEFDAVDVKFD